VFIRFLTAAALLTLLAGCGNTRKIDVEFYVVSTVQDPIDVSYADQVIGQLEPNTFPPRRFNLTIEVEDSYNDISSSSYTPTCRGIYITARNTRTGKTSRSISAYACERGASGSQQPPSWSAHSTSSSSWRSHIPPRTVVRGVSLFRN